MNNPFKAPDQSFDLVDFLDTDINQTEIMFKNFFSEQVNNDLIDHYNDNETDSPPQLKNYLIHRYSTSSPLPQPLELIQAYIQSQAAYLFLLNEVQLPDCFPFTERLRYWLDMSPLTPYDLYVLTVDTIFDSDLPFNDYVTEVSDFCFIRPFTFSPSSGMLRKPSDGQK